MCPACIATVALVAAGATSTSGLAALVVKKIRAENEAKNINPKTQTEGEQNENQNREEPNEPSESGVVG
jgi:hypothetical protein